MDRHGIAMEEANSSRTTQNAGVLSVCVPSDAGIFRSQWQVPVRHGPTQSVSRTLGAFLRRSLGR